MRIYRLLYFTEMPLNFNDSFGKNLSEIFMAAKFHEILNHYSRIEA